MLNIQVADDRQRIWTTQVQDAACYKETVQCRVKARVIPCARSNWVTTAGTKRKSHGPVLRQGKRSSFDAPHLHAAATCAGIYVERHVVSYDCELAIGNGSSPPVGRVADISVMDGMGDGLLRPGAKAKKK